MTCRGSIAESRAVFLHCDCCIAYCLNCVLTKISHSNTTYREFVIECPNCESAPFSNNQRAHPQIDEKSKETAEGAVNKALASAFSWFGGQQYSSLRFKEKVSSSHFRDVDSTWAADVIEFLLSYS